MGVTGIGGLFFRARDPEALAKWYIEHLGVGPTGDNPRVWFQQIGPTVFSPFPADSDYFAADHQWMINFRVDDLEALLASLREGGIEVVTKVEWDSPEAGRFARIHDPEGHPIELWEPGAPPGD